MSKFKLVICLVPVTTLVACASDNPRFPSLERRSYESSDPIGVVIAPRLSLLTLPADLAATVDALNRRHRLAQAAFDKDLPSVQTIAMRAAESAAASESWVNAHLQLSRLDKARADSVMVVREYDDLIAAQANSDKGFASLLTDAQKPAVDDVATQNAEIERLSRLIGE
jgi:hypothetical protein